jgi:hypothetical protein
LYNCIQEGGLKRENKLVNIGRKISRKIQENSKRGKKNYVF